MKALRSIHTHMINHYGFANANQQARTLSRFLISRKFLTIWMSRFREQVRHRAAIDEMSVRIAERTKLNVFMEWQ